MAEGHSRPAWAEIDLDGARRTTPPAPPAVRPGRPVRGGEGRRLRPRGRRRSPGPPRGGGGRAGRGHGRRGRRAAPRPASTAARSSCSPSRPPRPSPRRWPSRLTPTCPPRRRSRPLAEAARRMGTRADGAREGRHRHAPGGGRRRAAARSLAGARPRDAADCASRGCGPTWPWPTAAAPRTAAFTALQLDAVRRGACAGSGPPASPPSVRHAANSAGAIAWPGGPLRHGPLRHRPLRRAALARWWPTPSPRRRAATGCARSVAAGPGGGRARARAPASAPPTAGCGPCPSRSVVATVPARLRRRRAPAAVRRRRRGADRRPAAPAGRRWSPWTRSWSTAAPRPRGRSATRWSCSAARATRRSPPTEWAARLGTISYEVLSGIGPRVPRVVLGERPGRLGVVAPAPGRPSGAGPRPA